MCQSIYQGIQFRPPCNVCQKFLYKQVRSQNIPLNVSTLQTTSYASTSSYDSIYKDFFAPSCHLRKIYHCIKARSTRHHTLVHNPTILHTKTFFAPACHLRQKITSTSKYDSNTNLSCNIFLFSYLGSGLGSRLGLGLRLRSNQTLTRNWYKSLHATTQVPSYF